MQVLRSRKAGGSEAEGGMKEKVVGFVAAHIIEQGFQRL
jgi:hypothetical protein